MGTNLYDEHKSISHFSHTPFNIFSKFIYDFKKRALKPSLRDLGGSVPINMPSGTWKSGTSYI